MSRSKPERMLRRALLANASFSTLTAATCLLAADAVAEVTGLAAAELSLVGIDLGLFAAGIFFLLTRDLNKPWARKATLAIIALDALWVVGSVAFLAMPNSLTTAGQIAVAAVAIVVGDLAFFQGLGWRGMGRQGNATQADSRQLGTETTAEVSPNFS